jgi:hypothetical protein
MAEDRAFVFGNHSVWFDPNNTTAQRHQLGLEHRAGFFESPSSVAAFQGMVRWMAWRWTVTNPVARVEFVPEAVEVFGDHAELDDQDARDRVRPPRPSFRARGDGGPSCHSP